MKHLALAVTFLILLPAPRGWTQGGLKLKNRSSFTSVDATRNPFWPIGYVPGSQMPTTTTQAAPQVASIKAEDFNLTSISSFQGMRMAMINGKAVGEAQLVTLNLNGQKAKVQIVSVTDGTVVLRCMGQEITVPLKRPELDLMSKPATVEPRLHSTEEE